jgi:translation initiation factor 3 subunit B
MQLLDSKSLRATGVASFEWSPADNTLAFWAVEAGNQPARVAVVALPSRVELRQKNLFSVSDCQLTWHPNGHFLAVKVVRHTKSKKTLFNNLELFRVREDAVPVETVDVKATIKALAWEPNDGTRFGLITDDGPKPTVNFYDMGPLPDVDVSADQKAKLKAADKKPAECTLLKALPARNCSHLFWSPAGGFCVLAGIPQPNVNDYTGSFEFYDVDALMERGKEVRR